jgi:hypothetical protein
MEYVAEGGAAAAIPASFETRAHYTRVGTDWYYMDGGSEQTFTDSTPVTKDITVYAKFKGIEYSATFKRWEGSVEGPFTVEYPDPLSSAANFTLPEVGARDNYTDNGGGNWYANNAAVDGDTVLTGSITASPVWKGNSYTVKFHHNDGTETSTSVTVNYPDGDMTAKPEMKVNEFPTLSWTNHIFDDWRTEKAAAGNAFAAGAVINGHTDVYAHWMGLSGAEVQYGSLKTTKTTSVAVIGATLSYTLQIQSFVASGDYVLASLKPTSTAGSVSTQSYTFSSLTGDKTFTVKSPTSGKDYSYKVTVLQKSLANTQMATGGTVKFLKNGLGASATWDEIHTFTSSTTGTALTFNSNRLPSGLTSKVLVVAGGGGGGKGYGSVNRGGGGGGGGVIVYDTYTLSLQTYSVTVGTGGPPATSASEGNTGSVGGDSKFGSDFTAKGGGGGASGQNSTQGGSGGSGGGSTGNGAQSTKLSQTAPTSATKYGNAGGYTSGKESAASGGGGAGGEGVAAAAKESGAKGGYGVSSSITGTTVYYGGGGAAGRDSSYSDSSRGAYGGYDGDDNTGDGGCGGGTTNTGGVAGSTGGSGIVVVRFKFSE